MRSYRYLHLDVFTDRLFGGNQLAVFLDARGLSTPAMQAMTKEMNFSESTFVLPAEHAGTDARVRIFTPEAELPMAGHPTIGTAFAMARAGLVSPDQASVTLELGIGPVPVSLTWGGSELRFAWMTQLAPTFGEPIEDRGGAAAMLRLPAAAVSGTGLPVQVVSCGLPYLMVPLTSRRAVDSAALDATAYDEFRRYSRLEELPVFLFSTETGGEKAVAYSRMFAPFFGVAEDAATGSAAGPLGCYLVRNKVVTKERAGAMLSLQGVKMGRPSHLHISIGTTGAAPVEIISVRVGGESVVAGEGILYVK